MFLINAIKSNFFFGDNKNIFQKKKEKIIQLYIRHNIEQKINVDDYM